MPQRPRGSPHPDSSAPLTLTPTRARQAGNLTKALDYTRKFFQKAMTVKGTFEDFAEATALARLCP